MDILRNINTVTLLMACIFVIPILVGIIRPLTSDRIHRSFSSLLGNLLLLASLLLAIYVTRVILSDSENAILTQLYHILPSLQNAVDNNSVWVEIVFIIVLLLIFDGILHLLTIPIYRYAFPPLSHSISNGVKSMNGFFRRLIGGLWRLPKSIWLVLVFSLLLNFFTGFFNDSYITKAANTSAPYQLVQENVIQPLLNSSAVKDIKVILNDSFKSLDGEISDAISDGSLVKYFNGMTLDDAVKSNADIDAEAKTIVGSTTDDRQQAYLIYLWICDNLTYDNDKAEKITQHSDEDISSGAIVAYTTRTGVCFDFSCLYVAMCRSVGVKVRFVTGLGYTGTTWGDHAWNQAYVDDVWVNVDTTFGSSGINYFDRPYFYLDHKDGAVHGEW